MLDKRIHNIVYPILFKRILLATEYWTSNNDCETRLTKQAMRMLSWLVTRNRVIVNIRKIDIVQPERPERAYWRLFGLSSRTPQLHTLLASCRQNLQHLRCEGVRLECSATFDNLQHLHLLVTARTLQEVQMIVSSAANSLQTLDLRFGRDESMTSVRLCSGVRLPVMPRLRSLSAEKGALDVTCMPSLGSLPELRRVRLIWDHCDVPVAILKACDQLIDLDFRLSWIIPPHTLLATGLDLLAAIACHKSLRRLALRALVINEVGLSLLLALPLSLDLIQMRAPRLLTEGHRLAETLQEAQSRRSTSRPLEYQIINEHHTYDSA